MKLSWQQRLDFAALSAWLVASVFMAISAFIYFGQDFRGYYAAARVLLGGGDIYDYPAVAAMIHSATGLTGSNPFYYPPWFAVMVIPLSWLPYTAARVVWMAINVLAWGVGLIALSQATGWPNSTGKRAGWGQRWLVYLLATYLFAWVTWRYEQLGILLFMLLALALWAMRTRHFWWSGILLALVLTKPSVSVVAVAALLAWLGRNRHWPALAGFAVTLTVLSAISLPFLPSLLKHLGDPEFGRGLAYLLNPTGGIEGIRINTTFKDWLASIHLAGLAQMSLYVLSAVIGLSLVAGVTWRSASPVAVAAVAVVVGFWLAPYALQYDFPPLTVALFFGLRELGREPRIVRWSGAALLAGIASVPLWERPISDGFWIVIGLALLLGLVALSRPAPGAPMATDQWQVGSAGDVGAGMHAA